MVTDETPMGYEAPNWDEGGKVHNWKHYISPEIKAAWGAFTIEQRAMLARQAHELAMDEEWD